MNWSWIPNGISISRLVLVAPVGWLIINRYFFLALIIALVAGISDALDGVLAKRFGWQSRFGGLIDPIADKSLLVTIYLTLGIVGLAPTWLVWLILSRDVIIVLGALAYHYLIAPIHAAPSYLSKITTVLQIILALGLLLSGITEWILLATINKILIWITATASILSGVHYVWIWSANAWRNR